MKLNKLIIAALAMLLHIVAYAETRGIAQQDPATLKLTVLDASGLPVIGAAVMKADGSGEITDLDGVCIITLSGSDESLTVVCMGYQTKTVTIGTASEMTVRLEEDNQLLSESVVVGYGVQKKVNLTGAVAAVDQEQLSDRPVASVGQALQGVVPNLNITNTSGRPGASSNFNIRGNTSPNGGNPLILVDGVETDLSRINSNDIASISVLKDASSAKRSYDSIRTLCIFRTIIRSKQN